MPKHDEIPSTWSISGSPVSALFPGTLLMTGVETDEVDTKVYLDARFKGIHIHVHGETAEMCQEVWRRGGSPHLWARDIPSDALCVCTKEGQA